MFYKLFGLLGWLTVAFVGTAVLNYFLKWFNKHWSAKIKEKSQVLAQIVKMLTKIVVRNHRYLGITAAAVMALHMGLNIANGMISTTGLIAAGLLILTTLIGVYGAYVAKKRGKWFIVHRTSVVLMVFAVITHVLNR